MLRFDNVSFSYGEKTVLKKFSFFAEEGTTTCILGPSGAGKTTLIGLASGLLKPQEGEIVPFHGKRSTFVFQEDRLLPWLTAKENITAVGAEEARAVKFLQETGLADALEKYPDELSGGMKRRLSIARALAFGGDTFFFDEPLQGLDIKTSRGILSLIKQEISGKTAFIITHSPDEALAFAGRIILVAENPLKIVEEIDGGDFSSGAELKKYIEKLI